MGDDFAAPVKGILKAIDTGIKLTRRVSKSAGSASPGKASQIIESAHNLQRSLELGSEAVTDTYKRNAGLCGDQFAVALLDNKSIQSQLKELRIDMIDQINECPDFDDEPETFDPVAFTTIQSQCDKTCRGCIQILDQVGMQLARTLPQIQTFDEKPKDDRTILPSMRAPSLRKPVPPPSQPSQAPISVSSHITSPAFHQSPSEPSKPRGPWSIDSPSQFGLGAQSSSLGASPQRQISRDVSPSSKPAELVSPVSPTSNASWEAPPRPSSSNISSSEPDAVPRLIPKAIVEFRLNENEDFLERRRQSRLNFQKEFRKSVASIDSTTSFASGPPIISPAMGSPNSGLVSPVDGRNSRASLNGYDTLMTRQRSQGQTGSRSSRTSSLMQDVKIQDQRTHRQNSEDSIFGLRAAEQGSPRVSNSQLPGTDSWGPLATTLKLPGFGSGVEDGLEHVSKVDYDNEKILVSSDSSNHQAVSTASMKSVSVNYPMRHDASFYKFGGFCEGAKTILRGEEGFKVVKRPTGNYSTIISAKCVKCSYEVGLKDFEKDKSLDPSGIYGSSGIRWRQRFITKCHLRTILFEEPYYACIFCIEEHKTTEENDATVFFTVTQLFRHLARHPRPLPRVAGINTIYGQQSHSMVDFDIHFVTPDPKPSNYPLTSIANKVATRPSAHSLVTHHPKNSRSTSRDPDGNAALHFAAGAKFVGITFPDKFGGLWAIGYHDGEKGSMPSSSIVLEMPAKSDVRMDAQSSLIAFAKWDFKPKDVKDGGWLKFSKGERILCIGYTCQDQWCWSGQTTKGKWGLFPAAFVEGLQDGSRMGSVSGSGASVRSSGGLLGLGKFGSRTGSFGIGKKAKDGRRGSIKSVDSGSSGSMGQPGLEVVKNGW